MLTHDHYQHMRFALPLVLASEDQNCRIVTTHDIAQNIKSTNMVESRRLVVLNQGESANLGHVKISLIQGNKKKKKAAPRIKSAKVRSSKRSLKTTSSFNSGSNGSVSVSFSTSTVSSSSGAAASSFTGGDACGWIIKIMDEGPTIYHTGDTRELNEIAMIDELYTPSHVLMPIGEQCVLQPAEAALACKRYLPNCRTVIPIYFKSTSDNSGNRPLGF